VDHQANGLPGVAGAKGERAIGQTGNKIELSLE
jgi:hypothetical protein